MYRRSWLQVVTVGIGRERRSFKTFRTGHLPGRGCVARSGQAQRTVCPPVTTGGVIERAAVGLANQEAMGRWYGPIELARPVWSARHAMHPRASSINCADTFETTRLGGQQRGRMSAESQGQLQSRRHFPSGDLIEQPRQCSFPSAGVDGDLKARKSDDKRERRQFALLIARN